MTLTSRANATQQRLCGFDVAVVRSLPELLLPRLLSLYFWIGRHARHKLGDLGKHAPHLTACERQRHLAARNRAAPPTLIKPCSRLLQAAEDAKLRSRLVGCTASCVSHARGKARDAEGRACAACGGPPYANTPPPAIVLDFTPGSTPSIGLRRLFATSEQPFQRTVRLHFF